VRKYKAIRAPISGDWMSDCETHVFGCHPAKSSLPGGANQAGTKQAAPSAEPMRLFYDIKSHVKNGSLFKVAAFGRTAKKVIKTYSQEAF
jgi:hypothetical protein